MSRHVEPPMTIAEVAVMLGWDPGQTRRVLHKLNDETCGMLLRRESGYGQGVRYTVTRAALKKIRPEWFQDTRAIGDQIDDLRRSLQVLEKKQAMTATAVGQLFKRVG